MMIHMKDLPATVTRILAITCLLIFAPLALGQGKKASPAIELGAPFGDCAIFQHGKQVPVWGWSKSGTEVTVEFAGQKKTAKAGEDGKWMVKLDALKVNAEPAEMKISEKGGKSMTLEDILVGEVWMASGQSNMQWILSKSAGRDLLKKFSEMKESELPVIREFKVTNYYAHLHPIEHAEGEWSKDFGNFSAIAFAFAHKLHGELGVPIGILNCSFSQTAIEAWTPRDGYENSKSEHNKGIKARLLETDPSTPEHKKAWNAFYEKVMAAVEQNQKIADGGENQFVDLPNNTPGNMRGNRDATWLYNARLHPVVPYAISGCIWNQGYANSGGGLTYYTNLHAMIRGWRAVWGEPELPVYFHQFYSPGNPAQSPNHPDIGGTAEMRLATWLARDIPNTGMASQIDVQGAIHYGHKIVPGQRLALHALKNQYGKKVQADGPMYRDYKVEDNKLIISFHHAEGGLLVADTAYNAVGRHDDSTGFADPKIIENGDDKVTLFYLAGEDRVWHPAKVKIEGDKVVVTSKAVKKPMGVAYGTGGIGFQPNLYNKALLPTTPFIVYDHKQVTSRDWPDAPMKIIGVELDPSSVGLVYDYRKFPILSAQFRNNCVLQADQPVTIWGAAARQYFPHAEGKKVIHFSFNGTEKDIPVTKDMTIWKVTVPAMKASAEPKTIKVSLSIDGETVHERVVENVVVGDVWYVAGAQDIKMKKEEYGVPIKAPIRIMARMAKGVKSPRERPYSVATSTTPAPGNRFASYWGEAEREDAFAAKLAKAIHEKTGKPVGIIYMDSSGNELKHWMDVPSLANAPSLKADYEDIAAITPGTPFYKKNAERYIDAWKTYWGEYIPEMIATMSVPDGAAWGSYPTFGGEIQTDATSVYNCLLACFRRTQVKGMIFMTEKSMVMNHDGAHLAGEMSALANGWKRLFKSEQDPHFIYTIPSKALAARISKPADIRGYSASYELSAWSVNECVEGLIRTVIETAY